LDAALAGAKRVRGVTVERLYLHRYSFKPCTSCFACIRDEKHRCVLNDDFGQKGKGILFRKVLAADGIIVADPVHGWGASAMCGLFFERWYPFVWSGAMNGTAFASISCATNQGMQHVAQEVICRRAFCNGLRLVGQMAVHASWYADALKEARQLGSDVAKAARDGRKPFRDDLERFLAYAGQAWDPIDHYMRNLSDGTMTMDKSLIERAVRRGTFKRKAAKQLLQKAREGFREALRLYHLGNKEAATKALVECSAQWTHATWKEFLEQEVIGIAAPAAYRPMGGDE